MGNQQQITETMVQSDHFMVTAKYDYQAMAYHTPEACAEHIDKDYKAMSGVPSALMGYVETGLTRSQALHLCSAKWYGGSLRSCREGWHLPGLADPMFKAHS